MKTAISMDDGLMKRGDALAAEWQMPRSRVLALAAEEFVRKHEDEEVLEALNRAYGAEEEESEPLREARRRAHRRQVEGTW